MAFHPHMYSVTSGIAVPTHARSLVFDDMALDYWEVEAKQAAHCRYVSIHPRISIFFDNKTISLSEDKERSGTSCGLCFVPAGLQLWGRLQQSGRIRHLDLHIKRTALAELTGSQIVLARPLFAPVSPAVHDLAHELTRACDAGDTSRALAQSLIHRLVQLVFDQADTTAPTPPEGIAKVKAHILNHLDKRLHIEELATLADLSRTQFIRRFKSETGQSTHQWIIQQRIQLAQSLVSEGVSLVEVATRAGFSDQAHLNRAFKSATGVPPGVWARLGNSR
ncbi:MULTISPECIES: helix-turn-helix domain-containing protein [Roseobacteraceae]|uniref:HTH-type transcriptional activator Btr n=1 Tax=Pseudosulfitobacter pseudonitzschiae TaxID=1402135 RepID=A0A221K6I6_9RHOB|nr:MULTISPECIES: AraC family transcriptional regulator [Roseobacteraceae]ASM74490.1 HTH-type transcriptional activator Btr [Pseudosulfitobacter pseudonitzschiae]